MNATRVVLADAKRNHPDLFARMILPEPCPLCGDDIDIHEWLDVDLSISRVLGCDR